MEMYENDQPSFEFAPFPVFLHNPLYVIQLVQFWIRLQVIGRKGENKTGAKFSLYSVYLKP